MVKVSLSVLLICVTAGLYGQNAGVSALRQLLENAACQMVERGEGNSIEELEEHFASLRENPLRINEATVEELEMLLFLSDFQINSIVKYREESGSILSAAELKLLHGFNSNVVDLILPFISFDVAGGFSAKYLGKTNAGTLKDARLRSQILLKGWWEEPSAGTVGEDFYSQLKYKGKFGNNFGMGFTIEKDSGEKICGKGMVPFGDFASFHIHANDIYLGKGVFVSDFVAGDYSIRLGQGLAVWNTSFFGGFDQPHNVFKRGNPVKPYTSSDENRFFRGAAIFIKKELEPFREVGVTLFLSNKKVDARIKGNEYTSLPLDGLHNTESLLEVRKTLGELVYGMSVEYNGRSFKVGTNWVGYGYNRWNGRKVYDYNRYQMYDGQYGNFSVYANFMVNKVRMSLEAASDYGGSMAALAAVSIRIVKLDAAFVLRSYSRGYIAPYAGAYSTASSCSNQQGACMIFQHQLNWNTKMLWSADYTRYPWKRYGVDEPSYTVKGWWRCESADEMASWNVKVYGNYSSWKNMLKTGVRGVYSRQVIHWLKVGARGETVFTDFSSVGYDAGIDVEFMLMQEKLKIMLRGAYYDCREWNNRLYMYEYDLPSSFASRLMYGKGLRYYAMVSCGIGKWGRIFFKADDVPKVKLGLKMRFF